MGVIVVIGIILNLLIAWGINVKMKEIKEIAENKKLDQIADQFPENQNICQTILKKLKNDNVLIEEDKEANTTMYLAIPNKIKIANLKGSFTRIQTIAHECLHSIQSRRLLWLNFVVSNIYLLFFIVLLILSFFPQVQGKLILLSIFSLLGLSYYMLRAYLENDAMIKAPYLAKEYMKEQGCASSEEINLLVEQYDRLNAIGIKCINFQLYSGIMLKIVVIAAINWAVEIFF